MSTVGQRIKSRRLFLGLSVDELAAKLGKNRATVYRYESDEIENLPVSVVGPLASVLETTPAYLMGWEESPSDDLSLIPGAMPITRRSYPMLGNIACGEPTFAEETHDSWVSSDTPIDADFCLTAKGDSMIGARIHDGDIVFIKRMPMVENGQIAAVLIGDEATLKRVHYDPASSDLWLLPENPKYPPQHYTGEKLNTVRILGVAVAFQSNLL